MDERSKFVGWLEDGETFIGVFENQALDSIQCGHRYAMSFWMDQWEQAEVGKTRAPDTKMGLGWKYILIGKTDDPDEAIKMLKGEDDATEVE